MFGFGARRKYNGTVDTKLNNEYQIDTNNGPGFPGDLFYLELIQNTWSVNMTADEAALFIAMLYYCGILRNDRCAPASALLSRIQSVGRFGFQKGMISQKWWDKFSDEIKKVNLECGVE